MQSKKLKILFLTFHPQIGGGENLLLTLISNLDRKKFIPIVVIPKKGQLWQKLQKLKVETHILYLSGYLIRRLFIPGISPVGIINFYKLVKKIKPDLIHVNHLNLAIYAGIAAKLLKIPIVATAHGSWDIIYFYQDFANLFINRIFALTGEIKRKLTKRNILNKQRISIIPPGIDTNYFQKGNKKTARKKLNLPTNDIVITIVGRLDPVKDHITFLKAAQIVNEKVQNITFFIVGARIGDFTGRKNNYLDEIKNFLKKHPQLNKKTVFGGFIEDMQLVYHATDILVSSSPKESFGLTILEGASCGLPTIATIGNKIIKDSQTGFLVRPQNPKAIAEKILMLAKNSKLRKKLGENAQKHAKLHFQLQSYVAKIENIYMSYLPVS